MALRLFLIKRQILAKSHETMAIIPVVKQQKHCIGTVRNALLPVYIHIAFNVFDRIARNQGSLEEIYFGF